MATKRPKKTGAQGPLGVGGVLAEIFQRAAHPFQIAVGLQPDFEAQAFQHGFHGAGIVDRIVQGADAGVILGRQDKRHAPFGKRRRSEPEKQTDGK